MSTREAPTLSPPLASPPSFPFPFPAYSIQKDFMSALFRCLEDSSLGIFESPTGTGKSLSVICGALAWFHAHEDNRRKSIARRIERSRIAAEVDNDGDGDDDWFAAAVEKNKRQEELKRLKVELADLEEKDRRMEELRRRRKTVRMDKVQRSAQEFDELFKEMDEVRRAVRRELDAAAGEGKSGDRFDEQVRTRIEVLGTASL